MRIDPAGTESQPALDRLHDALALDAAPLEAVLHHVEHLDRRAVDGGHALAVDAGVALRLQVGADLRLLEVGRHPDRKGQGDAGVGVARAVALERLEDRGRVVACDFLAAAATDEAPRAREQQLQVVVELGHRANRAAAGAYRVGLVDGDRRRHAFDPVDLRPVHAVEELARVGREGLDVAALAFGIQRVEHQRALAAARHPGDDHQLAGGQVEVDPPEVVLARAADADGLVAGGAGRVGAVGHGGRR